MGINFSDLDLDNIRSRIDIVELIESYIPLKKSGANYKAICPFHSEKTPSFVVNAQKQIYHCFGCHKGGEIFRFVMDIENITFPEAVRKLADRCGYILPESDSQASYKKSEKDELYQCIEKIAIFYHDYLIKKPQAQKARDYLRHRGIDTKSITRWKMGYAPPSGAKMLTDFIKNEGFGVDHLIKAGVLKTNEKTKRPVDRFFNRIMFPIFDEQERVISFGGRVMDSSLPKYINCPETMLYQKSKVLYGFSHSKQKIREKKSVLVVEGYFDVIQLHQSGVETAVAPCGTALTEDQINVLGRFADQFYLAFDSDQAGVNAALRKLDVILEGGIKANVVCLPQGEDPDSFVKKYGKDNFEKTIFASEPALDFRLKILISQFGIDDEYGRIKVAESMMELVSKQPNKMLAESWIKKIEETLGFSEEVLRSEFLKRRRKILNRATQSTQNKGETVLADPIPIWEKEIFKIILNTSDPEILETAKKCLKKEYFSNKMLCHLWEKIEETSCENCDGEIILVERLVSMYKEDEKIVSLLTEMVSSCSEEEKDFANLDASLKRLKKEYLQDRIKSCMESLDRAGEEEVFLLLKQLQELKQEKIQLGIF